MQEPSFFSFFGIQKFEKWKNSCSFFLIYCYPKVPCLPSSTPNQKREKELKTGHKGGLAESI